MSFTAFAATQVCIDVESLYHIVRRDWPVHRELHSLIGGSAIGLIVAIGIVLARPLLERAATAVFSMNADSLAGIRAETSGVPATVGGLLGGTTHSVLDAIMHSDVRPLWPFSDGHGLYRAIGFESLHLVCLLAAVIGLIWLWRRPTRGRQVV